MAVDVEVDVAGLEEFDEGQYEGHEGYGGDDGGEEAGDDAQDSDSFLEGCVAVVEGLEAADLGFDLGGWEGVVCVIVVVGREAVEGGAA